MDKTIRAESKASKKRLLATPTDISGEGVAEISSEMRGLLAEGEAAQKLALNAGPPVQHREFATPFRIRSN